MGKLYSFWAGENLPAWKDRVIALRGDVTAERLGLQENEYRMLTERCTHIVHGAASVKMNMPEDEAVASSCTATERILSLANSCRLNGQFRKLDYISTIGVGGLMQGSIPEQPLTARRGFHNTYESSKAMAEAMVLEELKKGLPVTIHRPSMIVGDSASGRALHFQIFSYLLEFLSGRYSGGFLPALGDYRLDIVPVDYAARIIAESVYDPCAIGAITHICSGEMAVKLSDLLPFAGRLRNGSRAAPRFIPAWLFNSLIGVAALVSPARKRKALRGFRHFLPYLKSPQFFDNTRTRQLFGHIALPRPADYLENVVSYYCNHRTRRGKHDGYSNTCQVRTGFRVLRPENLADSQAVYEEPAGAALPAMRVI